MKKLSALRGLLKSAKKQQAQDRARIIAELSELAVQLDQEAQSGEVLSDPPLGSDDPWTPRELEYLSMSRFEVDLLRHDGEVLPPRVEAKIYNFERIRVRDELCSLFRKSHIY